MTYKEALESLRFEVYEEGLCSYIEDELDLAIEALEKQVPKKPFKEVIAKKNTRMVCPVCFVKLHYLVERQNYCPDCGQALDWGGTE